MTTSLGEINSGLVGVSHITGNEYRALPSKSAIKPAGSSITVHTEKALAHNNSDNQLMKFVRGERMHSYTPQDNRELRSTLLDSSAQLLEGEMPAEARDNLEKMVTLLKKDSELEQMAQMARSILISA